jgi:hypothetical protein
LIGQACNPPPDRGIAHLEQEVIAMLTRAQRRRRATLLKKGAAVALFVVVLTPKLDGLTLPDIGFPLITAAVAAPLN